MNWQILADTIAGEPGIIIGSNVATFLGGLLLSRIWPKRQRAEPEGRLYNQEFCDERHRNLEVWMGKIDVKLDHLIKKE